MTTGTHFHSDFLKPVSWRDGNVAFLKTAERLWDGRKLLCSYVETLGISGLESFRKLEPLLVSPEQFIGVDSDNRVIRHFIGLRRPNFQVISEDVFAVSERATSLAKPPAAIFNFDMINRAGHRDWWDEHQGIIRKIKEDALRTWGEVIFLFTYTLEHGEGGYGVELERYAEMICRTFRETDLSEKRLLGRYAVKDVGQPYRAPFYAGAFHIYKSDERSAKMATLRVRFMGNRGFLEKKT